MESYTKYLIVISFDCLSALDFPMLEDLPHFRFLLEKGSFCRSVKTIYPSLTYPCHATIVTGNYPNRHGITSNTLLQPGRTSPDWYWHRSHIKGTTLYDEARAAGMTTAALLWPVTAKANIDFHMPEIFANRRWHSQIAVSLRNGSFRYQLELDRRFGHLRKGLAQPQLDDFVLESAVHTIKTKKPNLLLVHFTDLDTQRHYHGFSSEEAMSALRRHDKRLGRILTVLRESGLESKTTIAVLGDHSALDETKAVKPNVLLRELGLITVNSKGKITAWQAYCKSCDGSAYIYIKDDNENILKLVHKRLSDLAKEKRNGIEKILTGAEAGEKGADSHAAFMLEAGLGFYFTEGFEGCLIDTISKEDVRAKRYTFASHGYSPNKDDYETVLILSGKGIPPYIEVPTMHLVDEGPTFARLLGLDLGKTDGKVREEFLESN
ncbi:alkaline phosphatase family protein [Mesobacillus zeae]|uniref:Alkaline phosphatase family protein n=1 Tax=Mesobacillus zeae TaxID=1917180 RepID=A0A398AYV9_9BACI|nr:ectonucleotide pyrophosphatase/phosphodiesterase [Mesobacillus zeae]RID82234.1 alkaline phosphatase family protein [Mesobacillus zeae]